jgi:tungstate transport system ATP-binding protein
MNGTVYELRDVVKLYGQREVLHLDHLEIPRGEITCIVGPNGAGKSSLLRLLNFLESPTSGQIIFDGHPVNGQVPLALKRRVTTVFQRPLLLSGSVYENVAYGLKLRGEKGIEARVRQVLERVGLAEFARASVRTLSGGEAQRVALARAIVIEPEVLLLDEPTANLDPYNGSLIEKIVAGLNREQGTTIVMVTHNVFQAKRLAHRVAFLLGGRKIEIAPAEQFFAAPTDPRTAAFIRGEMVY